MRFLLFLFLLLSTILPASAQESTFKTYYPNGKLQEITHQGFFHTCGIPVGTDSLFSPAGKLLRTQSYSHFLKGEGCHSTVTIIETRTYSTTGKLKTVGQERLPYEGESRNCGVWKWYDTAGRVLRKKDWGECQTN